MAVVPAALEYAVQSQLSVPPLVRPSVERTASALGVLDMPLPGQVLVSEGCELAGWGHFPDDVICRVEYEVIDATGALVVAGSARSHVSRPDVAASLGAGAQFRGFGDWLTLRDRLHQPLRLIVVAESVGGQVWQPRPREFCVRPAPSSGKSRRELADALQPLPRPPFPDPGHVFVVTHDLGLGGGQLYMHELVRLLRADHGFKITVAAPTPGALEEELRSWGVPVVLADPPHFEDARLYAESVASLAQAMRLSGAGSVITNTLGMLHGVDAARMAGLPVIAAIHESFPLDQFRAIVAPSEGGPPELRDRWSRVLRFADAVVFEAATTKELFEPHLRRGSGVRVPYGIAPPPPPSEAHRAEVRRRLGFGDDDVVLLSVGTFEIRKAQALLVDAVRVLLDGPACEPVRLVLVGSSENEYSRLLHRYVRDAGLEGFVRLIRVTPELDDWYAAADVFVSVSDVESMPRTMLEAMARELPVLASRVFGVGELVEDGQTGWLFPPPRPC